MRPVRVLLLESDAAEADRFSATVAALGREVTLVAANDLPSGLAALDGPGLDPEACPHDLIVIGLPGGADAILEAVRGRPWAGTVRMVIWAPARPATPGTATVLAKPTDTAGYAAAVAGMLDSVADVPPPGVSPEPEGGTPLEPT